VSQEDAPGSKAGEHLIKIIFDIAHNKDAMAELMKKIRVFGQGSEFR